MKITSQVHTVLCFHVVHGDEMLNSGEQALSQPPAQRGITKERDSHHQMMVRGENPA